MAKWRVAPGTVNNSLHSTVEYNENMAETNWNIYQDETPYIEEVKRDRELLQSGKREMGYRKMCTIPDIVAIDLLQNHHLDIHDPQFMNDPNNLKKLKKVIQTDYPYLLVST